MLVPREYQERAIRRAREALADPDRPCWALILEAPTGSGKTVIASHLIQRCVAMGKRCMFLAHSRELVYQASNKLNMLGVHHGLIMAGKPMDPHAQVHVCSKDTLYSRGVRKRGAKAMETIPACDLVILDECHRSISPTWHKLLMHLKKHNPTMVAVGLSATPGRQDGRGLGDIYQRLVKVESYTKLIEQGHLVPTRVFAPFVPDMKGVKVTAGDYVKSQLEKKMNKAQIIGSAVDHYEEHASGRPFIAFGVTIKHSLAMLDEFRDRGIVCEHVDGEMDPRERDAILASFQNNEVQGICNCGVLTEGYDCQHASCAVIARPTRSLVLWRQMAGRVQRPHATKSDCVVIDMGGAVFHHGYPDEDITWVLSQTCTAEKTNKDSKPGAQDFCVACTKCGRVIRERVQFCPECGHLLKKTRDPKTKPGTLKELHRHKPMTLDTSLAAQTKYWNQCLGMAIGRGWKVGAASHMFKSKFGHWPDGTQIQNVPSWKQSDMLAKDFYHASMKQH